MEEGLRMLGRLKELHKFIDDMAAVKADLQSDNVDLRVHALTTLAALATDAAERADKIPGFSRMAAFMREQATDALRDKEVLLDAVQAHVDRINEQHHKSWDRMLRADDRRREQLKQEAETGEQPDMFGVWTEDGR